MNHPRVGITAYHAEVRWGGVWRQTAAFVPQQYVDFVTAAGGVPVVLPATAAERARSAVAGIDALILSGGPDVDPGRYGAEPDDQAESNNPLRDAWELAVLDAALARDIPVLAICRGLQVLNVAYGGTLHQHLPNVVRSQAHRISIGTFHHNSVRTVAGSRLERLIGPAVDVPCHHHQSVAEVGPGLVASAYAADGVVEGLEDSERSFVVGIQWHPEEDTDISLAQGLVDAARSGIHIMSTRSES